MRPNSVHMWRQSDCASYTLNYYQNDITFFTPQTHTQTGKNGFAASEFPIIYYFTAQLYKVFGPHEFILRLVNLSIFVVGLYCLFSLARDLTQSYPIAFVLVLLVVTSAYLAYYAFNFLVNTSSLAIALCGWLAFYRYAKSGRLFWLAAMAGIFTLATLLKVDAGISFVAIAIILFFENAGFLNIIPGHNKQWLPRILIFTVAVALCYSWYAYAAWFNKVNGTGQNLLGLYPIWDSSWDEIRHTINRLGPEKWAPHFQSYAARMLTVVMFLYLVLTWRKLALLHCYILLLLSVGCLAYFLLWFRAFADHDYYLINVAILPIFIWLLFLHQAHKSWRPKFFNVYVAGLLVLSVYNVYQTRQMMKQRYYGHLKESAHPAIYTITPYLRSIGIERTDLVVSVPDVSPNITLYLMNNPGYTEAFNYGEFNIKHFVEVGGAKYLIVSDSSYLTNDMYRPYIHTQIGHYQGVNIYQLP